MNQGSEQETSRKGKKHKDFIAPTNKVDINSDKVDMNPGNNGAANDSPPRVTDNLMDDSVESLTDTVNDVSIVKILVEQSRAPSPFECDEDLSPPT